MSTHSAKARAQPPHREACNECHSRKVRCITGSGACTNCAAAGAVCTYELKVPAGRPRKNAKRTSTSKASSDASTKSDGNDANPAASAFGSTTPNSSDSHDASKRRDHPTWSSDGNTAVASGNGCNSIPLFSPASSVRETLHPSATVASDGSSTIMFNQDFATAPRGSLLDPHQFGVGGDMDFMAGHDYMTWSDDLTGLYAWPDETTGSDPDFARLNTLASTSDVFGTPCHHQNIDSHHPNGGSALGPLPTRCSSPTMPDRKLHSPPPAQRPTLNSMVDFVLELQASRARHTSQAVDETGWLRDDDLAFVASKSLCAMAEDTIDEIQTPGSTISQQYTELYLIGKACTPIVEMIHTSVTRVLRKYFHVKAADVATNQYRGSLPGRSLELSSSALVDEKQVGAAAARLDRRRKTLQLTSSSFEVGRLHVALGRVIELVAKAPEDAFTGSSAFVDDVKYSYTRTKIVLHNIQDLEDALKAPWR